LSFGGESAGLPYDRVGYPARAGAPDARFRIGFVNFPAPLACFRTRAARGPSPDRR